MANGRTFSKKREAQIAQEAARKKPSKPAPEVQDGQTETAEMLEVNLRLTESQQKDLASWIGKRFEPAFNSEERTRAIARIRQNRENYENGVARDDLPFDNAHDVRLKWGAGQCDAISVRIGEGLFGQDPVCRVSPRNSRSIDKAPNFEKFLDYWHDEYWNLGDRGPDIVDSVVRDGHKVLFTPWRLEITPGKMQPIEKQLYVDPLTGIKRWVDIDSMNEMVRAVEAGLQPQRDYKIFDEKRDEVEMNGPDLEVLDFEDYVTVPWARPESDGKLPWEAVSQWYTLDLCQGMAEEGEFYAGVLEKIQSYIVNPPTPAQKQDAGGAQAKGSAPVEAAAPDAMLQFWLWIGDYKLPGEKRLSKIMALYHRETRTVCWARAYKYEHGQSPFDHLRFLSLDWRFDGVSAMELFESIEQAVQNLINYELDETYMQASTSFKYRENRWQPEDHPMRPWKGVGVRSLDDWTANPQQDRRPMDMNIMQMLLGFGEQRVQIGPYQTGQESPRNTRPTARGVFMLLEQAGKLFNRAVRGQLKTWKSVFRKEAALWQQMMPEYLAVDVLGRDNVPLFPLGMGRRQIIGKYGYDMSGNVENVLYEMDRQVKMGLYDLLKDNPLIKTSLSAFYHLTEDVLTSFKVKRKLLPSLEDLQQKLNLKPTDPLFSPQQERQLIAQLKARGLKDEEIQDVLQKLYDVPVDTPKAPPVPPVPGAAGPLSRGSGPGPVPMPSPEMAAQLMGGGSAPAAPDTTGAETFL